MQLGKHTTVTYAWHDSYRLQHRRMSKMLTLGYLAVYCLAFLPVYSKTKA